MKNNVFWLLFGSTALGLSLCGIALYMMILFAMAQDEILDFADDVQVLREEVEQRCLEEKTVPKIQFCIDGFSEYHDFYIQLQVAEPVIYSEEIGQVDDLHIYDYFDNDSFENNDSYESGFLATMPLLVEGLDKNLWLIIRDDFIHIEELSEELNNLSDEDISDLRNDEDGLDIALKGAFYGIFTLLFILALFLYFPVRKLNRWINDIQHASEQIGKQNYEVRLPQYQTQPLGNLALSFNSMAEKIQDHIRDKNVLANAIAHELRTPLTRFRLALGLLQRQPLEGLAKELVDDLERYTDDLEMITDNTLRLATLRDSKINLQTINLDALINNTGVKFAASFPHLKVEVSNEVCQLESDIGFLQLALDNVLSNACHYAESIVTLRQWQDDKQVYIEITDDGPGIPEKDVEYIQQAFTRLDKSRNRQTGGTGLGLAIVRLAIQRMQGQLKFVPCKQGTKIQIILNGCCQIDG